MDFETAVADMVSTAQGVVHLMKAAPKYINGEDRKCFDFALVLVLRRVTNRAAYLLNEYQRELEADCTDSPNPKLEEEQVRFSGEEQDAADLRGSVAEIRKRKPRRDRRSQEKTQ